jgi:hypothetical protein
MQVNCSPQQSRNSWQISFADLLALLLCFIILQYALRLPHTSSSVQTQKPILKRSVKDAVTWFQSRIDKRITISPQNATTISLAGQLNLLQVPILDMFGCSTSVLSNSDADIGATIQLQNIIKKKSASLFVTAGLDSRVNGLTLHVDLGDCK